MIELRQTDDFRRWLDGLRDLRARARIQVRLDRLESGNPGDTQSVGQGVSELRIDHGPGYRVYYLQHGNIYVLLLCGGDKRTQSKDIARARVLARQWKE